MEEEIKLFQKLGFSKMESSVYISLLKNPKVNGSQIAKILNVPRSSAYSGLEGLYKKGAIYLVPGESNNYIAKEPEKLIDMLKSEYSSTADTLLDDLSKYKVEENYSQFMNIDGSTNIINKLKELIKASEREIYLHTDMKIDSFRNEIEEAIKRGVRVILFSFADMDTLGLDIEFYYNPKFGFKRADYNKILMVSDCKRALIANGNRQNFVGTFTENKLFISVISDHIHHDIYLYKLENKFQEDLVNKDIQLSTEHENTFIKVLESIRNKPQY